MASSLLLLLDDIASVLDDVSVMTKVAVKKTAGVLGDDLALNAKQVAGVQPARELPVVWAVARGSAVNKLILVPAALASANRSNRDRLSSLSSHSFLARRLPHPADTQRGMETPRSAVRLFIGKT
jgi:hypothetical protein